MLTNKNMIMVCLLSAVLGLGGVVAYAEETNAEKAESSKNKAVDATKKTYRGVKDEACEMVDGKMNCLGKKVKNKAKNASDKAKTKAKEIGNKAD